MDKREVAAGVLARLGGVPAGELRPEMELVADLGIDSPKALELLVELEEALGVEISDEDAARMETVGDVFDYAAALA
ncbi:MAG TPA: phosphopantetheine-binding protein [Thermoanaerobaculia bacterium]|nr:phosphopantetheine-binding protein [Thermoanaerobaculia bacterium]